MNRIDRIEADSRPGQSVPRRNGPHGFILLILLILSETLSCFSGISWSIHPLSIFHLQSSNFGGAAAPPYPHTHFLYIGTETRNEGRNATKKREFIGEFEGFGGADVERRCALHIFKTKPVRAAIFVENGLEPKSSSVRSGIV